MSNAIKLGQWILAQTPYRREAMTHLKLQKLAFYCYGAALAFGCEDAVGDDVTFEAWEHGPVCRELWLQHRDQGATPIPFLPPEAAPPYAPEAARHMTDALVVYSPLSAWSLRQESHTEAPWIEAHNRRPATLSTDALRAYFEKKFAGREVKLPEYLGHTSSAALDGIPSHGYGDRLCDRFDTSLLHLLGRRAVGEYERVHQLVTEGQARARTWFTSQPFPESAEEFLDALRELHGAIFEEAIPRIAGRFRVGDEEVTFGGGGAHALTGAPCHEIAAYIRVRVAAAPDGSRGGAASGRRCQAARGVFPSAGCSAWASLSSSSSRRWRSPSWCCGSSIAVPPADQRPPLRSPSAHSHGKPAPNLLRSSRRRHASASAKHASLPCR